MFLLLASAAAAVLQQAPPAPAPAAQALSCAARPTLTTNQTPLSPQKLADLPQRVPLYRAVLRSIGGCAYADVLRLPRSDGVLPGRRGEWVLEPGGPVTGATPTPAGR